MTNFELAKSLAEQGLKAKAKLVAEHGKLTAEERAIVLAML